jgi:hypothetical protein
MHLTWKTTLKSHGSHNHLTMCLRHFSHILSKKMINPRSKNVFVMQVLLELVMVVHVSHKFESYSLFYFVLHICKSWEWFEQFCLYKMMQSSIL